MKKKYGVFTITDGCPVLISDHLIADMDFNSEEEALEFIDNVLVHQMQEQYDYIFMIMPIYVN